MELAVYMRRQFGRPDGPVGSLAGAVMAVENREVNRFVVHVLRLGERDRVLELGCGPGVGLREAAKRASFVAGVDPSPVMARQARRRNRRAVASGRIEVVTAPAEKLPFPDEHFTCAFGVNSVQHWDCVRDGLVELHRVLRPLGRFVLARRLQLEENRLDPHAHGATEEELEAFERLLREAAFVDVRRNEQRFRREAIVLISGRRPERPC